MRLKSTKVTRTEQVNFRLTPDEYEKLAVVAGERYMSVPQLARSLILKWIDTQTG